MTDYTHTPTYRKGRIGEEICKQWLEQTHEMAVFTTDTPCPHDCDLIAHKKGKKWILGEVKVKPKRRAYDDTGIDTDDYNHYKKISEEKGMPLFLFFVDNETCTVYGNWLEELEKEVKVTYNGRELTYPWVQSSSWGELVYFPLSAMAYSFPVPEEKCEEINNI